MMKFMKNNIWETLKFNDKLPDDFFHTDAKLKKMQVKKCNRQNMNLNSLTSF